MKWVVIFSTFILIWYVYSPARAYFVIPYFDITVVKNTVGGDGVFNFHFRASQSAYTYDVKDFKITTNNGSGFVATSSDAFSGATMTLTEGLPDGWKNTSVVCTSSNPSVSAIPIPGGVNITPKPYSAITCVFTNTKQNLKTPVLIVPGILGTDLIKDGRKLWLNLFGMFGDVGDDFLDVLSFNNNLQPLDLAVSVSDIIGEETFSGFSFDYTYGLITELTSSGYSPGTSATSTLFTFPYDWRYGVSGVWSDGKTNVDALRQKIADIRSLTGSDKVDVIAHSTGGLLVKKYAMEHPTDNHIGKAVFVGVPNLGAPKAVKTLLQGDNFGIPFLSDAEMKKISANLPVSYELSPSKEYVASNGGYVTTADYENGGFSTKNLDFNQTIGYLSGDHALNTFALTNAGVLHSQSFDVFDMRNANIDFYSIVGCKSGTVGGITEY
ncbi:MAG: hypothetical protein WC797_04920, partial [Candidatus Paceibacterota bacterium]